MDTDSEESEIDDDDLGLGDIITDMLMTRQNYAEG